MTVALAHFVTRRVGDGQPATWGTEQVESLDNLAVRYADWVRREGANYTVGVTVDGLSDLLAHHNADMARFARERDLEFAARNVRDGAF